MAITPPANFYLGPTTNVDGLAFYRAVPPISFGGAGYIYLKSDEGEPILGAVNSIPSTLSGNQSIPTVEALTSYMAGFVIPVPLTLNGPYEQLILTEGTETLKLGHDGTVGTINSSLGGLSTDGKLYTGDEIASISPGYHHRMTHSTSGSTGSMALSSSGSVTLAGSGGLIRISKAMNVYDGLEEDGISYTFGGNLNIGEGDSAAISMMKPTIIDTNSKTTTLNNTAGGTFEVGNGTTILFKCLMPLSIYNSVQETKLYNTSGGAFTIEGISTTGVSMLLPLTITNNGQSTLLSNSSAGNFNITPASTVIVNGRFSINEGGYTTIMDHDALGNFSLTGTSVSLTMGKTLRITNNGFTSIFSNSLTGYCTIGSGDVTRVTMIQTPYFNTYPIAYTITDSRTGTTDGAIKEPYTLHWKRVGDHVTMTSETLGDHNSLGTLQITFPSTAIPSGWAPSFSIRFPWYGMYNSVLMWHTATISSAGITIGRDVTNVSFNSPLPCGVYSASLSWCV